MKHHKNSRLDRIKNWPALARDTRYSASALAQHCGVSPRQLERFFQDRMQRSPHNWLRELRMNRAVELLREGAPIKQVAQELCYKDAAHFCRDFKNYFGVTPGQFASHTPAAASPNALPSAHVAFRQ